MDTILYVVLGLVAAAVVAFVVAKSRKKELPPAPGEAGRLPAASTPPTAKPAKSEPPASPKEPAVASKKNDVRISTTDDEGVPVAVDDTSRAAAPPSSKGGASSPSIRPPPSKRDLSGLRKGLSATRGGFIAKLTDLLRGKKEIDPQILEQIEEVLLTSDVGVKTTEVLLGRLRDSLSRNELKDEEAVWKALKEEALRIVNVPSPPPAGGTPHVILMVGVNGVGKTTTIGKLATRFSLDSKKVLLAAGDTFRAAAVQQLEAWGKRVGAEVVKGKEGADPGAVAFEATTKAKEAGIEILLVDTAGRLHTKAPLMDEIKKVKRTIAKAFEGAPHETLLVLDATTGQNALTQAQLFKEALDLTGIVLTKLDGTAKGGVVLGICDELKVPVKFIGLGERAEDLRDFVAEDFVEALFGPDEGEARAA